MNPQAPSLSLVPWPPFAAHLPSLSSLSLPQISWFADSRNSVGIPRCCIILFSLFPWFLDFRDSLHSIVSYRPLLSILLLYVVIIITCGVVFVRCIISTSFRPHAGPQVLFLLPPLLLMVPLILLVFSDPMVPLIVPKLFYVFWFLDQFSTFPVQHIGILETCGMSHRFATLDPALLQFAETIHLNPTMD